MKEFGPDSNLNDIIVPKNNKPQVKKEKNSSLVDIALCGYLIVFGIILCLIIIALIIIILIPNTSEELNKELKTGEIKAVYEIDQDNQDILILGEGFKDLNKLTIYINNNTIKNTEIINNYYKIKTKGLYTIEYKINTTDNDFEMEKMFKNVIYLKTIEMNSTNNLTLKSINSAFDGCINLESFKIK